MKVWVEDETGAVLLSDWRVMLLEAVEATGSLTRAAEAMAVPYRTAWDRIRQTETALGAPLIETASGGRSGGGSRLTATGRAYIASFHRLTEGLEETVQTRFDTELRDRLR